LYFIFSDIFEKSENDELGSIIVPAVDFEEGESVSASDDEVTGYTGDLENYTESEIECKSSVPEGALININDNDNTPTVEELKESGSSEPTKDTITTSVTNESVSEIAEKLADTQIEAEVRKELVKPGKPVKVTDISTGGYSSSGEETTQISRGVESNQIPDPQRRKKFRKHAPSFSAADEEGLTSSGEYKNNSITRDREGSITEIRHKPKKKNSKKQDKLVDIETPPQTPRHNDVEQQNTNYVKPQPKQSGRTVPVPGFKSSQSPQKTVQVPGSQKKRKRTRHKVYLDDPDVHQLITDHVLVLQKYLEDVRSGRVKKRELQPISKILMFY